MAKLRFSTKTVFVAISLICIFLGYAAFKNQQLSLKINRIEKLGGLAHLSADCNSRGEKTTGPFLHNNRSVLQICIDYWNNQGSPFRSIVAIDLSGTHIANEDLEILSQYDSVIRLDLSDTEINLDGIKHIEDLKQLRYLRINDTNLSIEQINLLQEKLTHLTIVDWDPQFESLRQLLQYQNTE